MKTLFSIIALTLTLSAFGQEEEATPISPYSYPSNQKIVINGAKLGSCLAQVTRQVTPKFFLDRRVIGADGFDTFMDYLGARADREYDYETGLEPELRDWIFKQPHHSIDPYSLYKKSIILNKGNVFGAVLTIHQLLRNEARYTDKKRYTYESNSELQREFFDRFIDIRGDLQERGPGFRGDHGGTWYRIWGMVLHRLMWEPEVLSPHAKPGKKQKFVGRFGGMTGIVLGKYVENSKRISNRETDITGKVAINAVASKVAGNLVKGLWYDSPSKNISGCKERKYLKEESPSTPSQLSLPKVNFSEQFGPTREQVGGTCYAHALTGAVEAALFRRDRRHRSISPEYALSRVFATRPTSKLRLGKTFTGAGYADGASSGGEDMFELISEDLFTKNLYVEHEAFKPRYAAFNDKGFDPKELLKPSSRGPKASYVRLVNSARADLKKDPALKDLTYTSLWKNKIIGKEDRSLLLPLLTTLIEAKIPALLTLKFDVNRLHVSEDGGRTWNPLPQQLLAFTTFHAVVLERVERDQWGETVLILRDSYKEGTVKTPQKSKLKVKLEDAMELITEVMIVTGEWDKGF